MNNRLPENLLCSDSELAYLKTALEAINEMSRILKESNEQVRVKMPHSTKDFAEYGKEHPGW